MAKRIKWDDVRDQVETAARRTAKRYGLDADDLIQDGYLEFRRALRWYDGRPVERILSRYLLRLRRPAEVRARRTRILKRVRVELDMIVRRDDPLDELSEVALSVVRLALHSRAGLKPSTIRRSLRRYLSEVGFLASEIEATFAEIAGALRS
jgi:hypothetical protein